MSQILVTFHRCVGGIMVSIAAFQAVDPGSIPGRRRTLLENIFEFLGKNLSMPWPGFEPGLLRPQRRVLTTRRSRLRTVVVLVGVNVVTHQSGGWWWVCLKVECDINVKQFSWCSGYHICLTHRRSPVRSRAKTCFPRGLTARISGFHPGGPGSTPGVGIFFSDCRHVE